MTLSSSRGIALVTVLLVSSLVFTMALGLSLVVSVNQLVVRNHSESAALAAAARAGVELAAHELADADWNAVLTGWCRRADRMARPTGPRVLAGGTHPRSVSPDQSVELRVGRGVLRRGDAGRDGRPAHGARTIRGGGCFSTGRWAASPRCTRLRPSISSSGSETMGGRRMARLKRTADRRRKRGAACSACTPPPSAAMAGEGRWRPSWYVSAALQRPVHRVFPEFVCNPGVIYGSRFLDFPGAETYDHAP